KSDSFAIRDLSRGSFAFQYGFKKAEGCQPLLVGQQHCAGEVSRMPQGEAGFLILRYLPKKAAVFPS
ncbi:hypothetical protein UD07_09375, partial [Campylobacter coli]